jgi:hypothetical protein
VACMDAFVITPTLGESPWLFDTVDSVARLEGRVRHRLVAPAAVCGKLRRRFPGLEVIEDDGRGIYEAINLGCADLPERAAVCWLHDDDLLGGAGALGVLAALERSGGAVAYGKVRVISTSGRMLGWMPVARSGADVEALMGAGVVPLAQQGTWVRVGEMRRLGALTPPTGWRAMWTFSYGRRRRGCGLRMRRRRRRRTGCGRARSRRWGGSRRRRRGGRWRRCQRGRGRGWRGCVSRG